MKHIHIGSAISLLLTIAIFWQFFFKGLSPFPGNYMLAWYEPFKSEHSIGETITLPHKPVGDDVFRQLFPFKMLATDMIKRFTLPLWNPYNGAGMPLMATMHPGFLNPFNLFFFILPPHTAWAYYILSQSFLLTFFTFLYCRKISLSKSAAIFSAISVTLSAFVIARLVYGEYVYVFASLPLLLYLSESIRENPRTKKILLIPLVVAWLCVSGHPQAIFYVLFFSYLYGLFRLQRIKERLKAFLLLVLGIGLASVQLAPTVELFLNANISTSSSSFIFDKFLLSPSHLVSLIIPNYFGNQGTYNYWGTGDFVETAVAVGSVPSLFAFIALTSRVNNKRGLVIFFAVATILTILSTLDWFVSRLLFQLPIPILSTGAPTRIFMLTTFSLAVLGGFGFQKLETAKNIPKRKIAFFASIMLLILFVTYLLYSLHAPCKNLIITNCRTIALRNTLLEFALFTLTIGILITQNVTQKRHLQLGMVLLVAIAGLYNAHKFLPFSAEETFFPQNNLIKALQEKTKDGRVFGIDEASIRTDFATYFRYFDTNFYDPLYIKRYGEFISFANEGKIPKMLPRSDVELINNATISANLSQRRERALALLGAKYLISRSPQVATQSALEKLLWADEHFRIEKNPRTLPRAYIVGAFEVIDDQKKLLERLFDPAFSPEKSVLLEKKPKETFEPLNVQNGKVAMKEYEENNVVLETQSSTDSILAFSDNYYPGWKAFVDNNETSLYRANYTFRAIVVPSGRHEVRFSYRPASLRIGLLLSSGFSLFYLLLIIYWKKVYGYKKH